MVTVKLVSVGMPGEGIPAWAAVNMFPLVKDAVVMLVAVNDEIDEQKDADWLLSVAESAHTSVEVEQAVVPAWAGSPNTPDANVAVDVARKRMPHPISTELPSEDANYNWRGR